jgi:hypothetical protein
MARILIVIELSDEENRPQIAADLAARLREQFGSVARAAQAVGVTRQAFHDWLHGHHVAMKHLIAMNALAVVGDHTPVDTALDAETGAPGAPGLPADGR